MIDHQTKIDTGIAGVKAAPAIAGTLYAGLTMSEWAALLTALYVLLQIGLLLPRYYKGIKKFLENRKTD